MANLHPNPKYQFKKGNPGGGRPKTPDEIKLKLADALPGAIETVIKISQTATDVGVRLSAAKYLIDRNLGKPTETQNNPGMEKLFEHFLEQRTKFKE